ncbi:MAG: discoidin domain-containing protein [Saccharofermentanales bacterium]
MLLKSKITKKSGCFILAFAIIIGFNILSPIQNEKTSAITTGTNLALSATIYASSTYGVGYEASKANDGTTATRWASAEGTGWLMLDFGSAKNWNQVVIDESSLPRTTAYQVLSSPDGSTWTSEYTGTTIGANKTIYLKTITKRYLLLSIYGATSAPTINELAVYGPTSSNLSLYGTLTASSTYGAGYEPSKAADSSLSTRWAAASGTTGWLKIDFGSAKSFSKVIISEIALPRVTGFQIQYSSNGSSWTTCYTGTTIGACMTAYFTEVTYRYVRLNITSASSSPTIEEFVVTKTPPPIVGVVRWDGQVGFSKGEVGAEEERALGPSTWDYKNPFYAIKTTSSTVALHSNTQAIMDQEIAFAKDAGIGYWVFCYYSSGYLAQGYNLYQSSSYKNDVKNCLILSDNETGSVNAIVDFMKLSNYQTVTADNRPIIYTFGLSAGNAATIAALRERCANEGVANPYVVVMEWSSSGASTLCNSLGADAISQYASLATSANTYSSLASADQTAWGSYIGTGKNVIPWATAGWDTRPRNECNPAYIYASYGNSYYALSTGLEFEQQLQAARYYVNYYSASCPANTTISYSWNEFSEGGTTVCPKNSGNRDHLDAVKNAVKGATASSGNGSYTSLMTSRTLSSTRNNYSGFVGMKITVGNTTIVAKELGRYFVAGNSRTHVLKIVRASDNVEIASVGINMSAGSADANGIKYAVLETPVNLRANTAYYIMSSELNGGDLFYDYNNTVTINADATLNCAVFGSGYNMSYSTYGSAGNCYGPVNVKYEKITPVDDPEELPKSSDPYSSALSAVTLGTLQNTKATNNYGMKITVGATPITVSSVGRKYCADNTGYAVTYIIRASDNVTIASNYTFINATAYLDSLGISQRSLNSPVTLAANTAYYIVALETNGGNKWYSNDTSITPAAGFTVNGSAEGSGTTWTIGGTANRCYGPMSFEFN